MDVRYRRRSRWLLVLLVLLALLVLARVALPSVVQWYVNKKLDEAEGYTGQVGDVDLHLIRGAYQIKDVHILSTNEEVETPIFDAELVDLSVDWRAAFRGALVAEVWLVRPVLNIIDEEVKDDAPKEEGKGWQQIIQDLFPIRIDKFVAEDGEIHFRNFTSDPPVDIYLREVYLKITNFTNSREVASTVPTTLEGTAIPMTQGDLDVKLEFDPYAEQPQFDLNVRLTDLKVSTLNDFLDAYANLDVEAGSMDLAVEMAADQGKILGYVKPVIRDLEVFQWQADVVEQDQGLLRSAWEAAAGFISEVFENKPQDTFASRVPIAGELDSPETGVVNAVFAILRNAFLEAIEPQVEGSIELEDVQGYEPKPSDADAESDAETDAADDQRGETDE